MRDFHKLVRMKDEQTEKKIGVNVADNEYLLLGHMHQKWTPIKYGKTSKTNPTPNHGKNLDSFAWINRISDVSFQFSNAYYGVTSVFCCFLGK